MTLPTDRAFEVEPTFVVRVAGMPMGVLARLSFDRTTRLLDELLDIEQWLRANGERLSDGLHGIVGGTDDRTDRRRLISLRRDVFHARMPKIGKPDRALLARMPLELATDIEDWYARIERHSTLHDHARSELEAESAARRDTLRELAADRSFQQGIAVVSRDLYPELVKWLCDGSREDRRLEQRLVKYLARTAAKTSPSSTFTSSGQGRWAVDEGPAVQVSADLSRRGVVELNAMTLRRIHESLATWPQVRPLLGLEVNGSLTDDGEFLRFISTRGAEALRELAGTPTLRRFLTTICDGAERTYGDVVAGLTDLDPDARSAQITGFLDKLIDVGLVEIGFGIPSYSTDQLGQLVQALAPIPGAEVAAVRDLLAGLRGDLGTYARTDDPAQRFRQANAIDRRLAEISRELGGDLAGEVGPRNAFYEDTLLPGVALACSAPRWQSVLDDLDLLRALAGPYDRFLPGRLAAAEFFTDHHGVGARTTLLEFYGEFCKEISHPAGWREGYRVSGQDLLSPFDDPFPVPDLGLATLSDVAQAQHRITRYVGEQPVDDSGTRHLDPQHVRELVSALPDVARPIRSVAFYCQAMVRDGEPHAVLNELTSGFGRSRARLGRLAHAIGSDWGATSDGRGSAALRAGLAEIAGATGSNLNLKRPTTPYEISYPGTVSARPDDERVPLGDLLVELDPDTRRLRLIDQRTGTEINPVHLGATVEFLLPHAYRFLIQIFGQAVPRFEFIKQLATSSPHQEWEDGTQRFPRLCLGNVVLNRTAWLTRAYRTPQHDKGQPWLDYVLDVHRWRREHHIPMQCFIRTIRGGFTSPQDKLDRLLDKSHKPLYVDFSSDYFVQVFEQAVRDSGQLIVLEEVLPAREDLVLADAGEFYASEFVIEIHGSAP